VLANISAGYERISGYERGGSARTVRRGIAALHYVDWSALGRWVYCSNQWPLMYALGQERTSPFT